MVPKRKHAVVENLEPRLFLSGEPLAAPALADQVISHNQGQLVVALPATDAQGDILNYSASVRGPATEAYALKQRLGLTTYASQYDNYSGRGDKWFQDTRGGWHYLLGDGRMYQLGSGTLEGQLDTAYHADPRSLLAVQDAGQPPAVGLDVSGNSLTVAPPTDFVGKFLVDVTASDGAARATSSFSVTVTNHAPVLDVADVTMSHTQDTLALTLPSTDADGDTVTYTASVAPWGEEAYALKQRLGIASYASRFDNWGGRGEKWLTGQSGAWFTLLADGRLYRYGGGLEGQLDAGFYANPQLLVDAQPAVAPDVTVTVLGNQLVIDPAAGYAGKFQVRLTASDGLADTRAAFSVDVTNAAPVLALADQTMPHSQDTLTLALPATDADGDIITYTAAVRFGDATAWNLKQQLGLTSYASRFDNCSGRGEKWIIDTRGGWYYLTSNGNLYNYAGGRIEGTVDAGYYANPQSLIDVQAPQPVDIPLTLSGNQLTIDPPASYAGRFTVDVTASDGILQTADSFAVAVTNAAPVLALTDQAMPVTQDKLTLTLPAIDADNDTVTYTASVAMPATQAYDLKTRLGLTTYVSQWNNSSGRGEKWLGDSTNHWYYMLADGKVYRYSGGTLEGQVDTAYYANPQQLITVQPTVEANIAVSVLGNQVVLDPANGFYGQFQVTVTASDGVAAPVTGKFTVTVLPLNDPATYTAGAQTVTRIVPVASGLEFVALGTDQADTLIVSQTADKVTLTTKTGSTDYAGRFTAVTFYGFGGDDTIRTTHSVTATVTIRGGAGNDSIFVAGTGTATVYGDAGDDLIVTVGGGAAVVYGGDGLDSFWVDSADRVADTAAAETAAASVHSITRFYQPTGDPAKAVSLEIDGQDIVDPTAAYAYRSFASSPLFVDGPEYNDIRQGAVGDCYFMAALASLAQTDPMTLQQMVAPMGDGTYAVRFYGANGVANYVRVDASLPAYGSTPAYGRLSPEGEIWVAMAEKAYAQFRSGSNSYASLNSGWMEPVYKAVTNAATGTVYTTIASLANYIGNQLNAGHALTAASVSNPVGPAVGGHAYMIKAVDTSDGQSYVTVYNPWGFDGASWDSNSGDGLLRMTLATFQQNFFAVSYCMA
jgi:hypothetical protein